MIVVCLQNVFKHNFGPAVATVAGYTMLLSYPQTVAVGNCIPSVFLHSESSATGKSTAIKLAQVLHGQTVRVRILEKLHWTLRNSSFLPMLSMLLICN